MYYNAKLSCIRDRKIPYLTEKLKQPKSPRLVTSYDFWLGNRAGLYSKEK